MLSNDDYTRVNAVFNPAAPIDDPHLFVGRRKEKEELKRAILGRGRHIVVFGERGVGKTSLVKVTMKEIDRNHDFTIIRTSCSARDSYQDVVGKLLKHTGKLCDEIPTKAKTISKLNGEARIPIAKSRTRATLEEEISIGAKVMPRYNPDAFSSELGDQKHLFILDEFDRLEIDDTRQLIAETVKTLSDGGLPSKFVICGVADSMPSLVGRHVSAMRSIVSIEVPQMSCTELNEVISKGCTALNLDFTSQLRRLVIQASHGLPYFVHLLCEELALKAITHSEQKASEAEFFCVLENVLNRVLGVVQEAYNSAIEIYGVDADDELDLSGELEDVKPSLRARPATRRLMLMALSLVGHFDGMKIGALAEKLDV